MLRLKILRVLLVVSVTSIACAQGKPSAPLTLQECVERALNKNFDLKIQRFTTQSAHDDVIATDAGYDPTLILGTGAAGSKNANFSPAQTTDQTSSQLSVSQKIVTGASVSASTALNRNQNNFFIAPPLYNPVYNSDVTLSITHYHPIARQTRRKNYRGIVCALMTIDGQLVKRIANRIFEGLRQ